MTPKQKSIKLNTIKNLIESAGFKLDSYGNYKNTFNSHSYRIKLKPINIRIETKLPEATIWHKITSQPIVTFNETSLINWLAKFAA
jgi:hypothetical protein